MQHGWFGWVPSCSRVACSGGSAFAMVQWCVVAPAAAVVCVLHGHWLWLAWLQFTADHVGVLWKLYSPLLAVLPVQPYGCYLMGTVL